MPRNGSGTYVPPSDSWNPAVPGTTISSTDWVAILSDLASAVTASIANDGQTPILANLPMGGFKHTGVADGSANTDYTAIGQIKTTALNVQNDSYAATGMPGNISLAAIAGAGTLNARYRVTVAFNGLLTNTNGTPIAPQITVAVKNGGTTLQSRAWNVGANQVATGFANFLAFTVVFDVIAPASGTYTVVFTDTESDGGTHGWTLSCGSASAVTGG